MKLSELIAAYGDDKVQMQNLDQCADTLNMNKGVTRITFGTEQPLTPEGTSKLGLVVWLDRERVKEISAAQSDFDSRIRSSLVSPAEGREPVAWATPDVLEHLRKGNAATVAHKSVGDFSIPLYADPLPVADGWRTMESAPDDFVTEVDIWARGSRYTDCLWMKPTYGKDTAWCYYHYDDSNGPVYSPVREPEFWMRLPTSPLTEQSHG